VGREPIDYFFADLLPTLIGVVTGPIDETNRLLRVEAHGELFGLEGVK
jgi:hypothetical protein